MGKPKPLYIAKHMLKHGSCPCSARRPLMRIVGRSEKSNGAYRHDTRAIREPPVTNRAKQRTNKKFAKGPIDMKTAVVHTPSNGALQTLKRASFPTNDDSVRRTPLLQPTFCRDCTRMTIDNPCDNPSFVPAQPSQYNSTGTQSAQVSVIVCHCLNCSLSYVSIQPLGGLDHLPVIGSAGPYPAMNYVNPLPPTRYTSSVGYDNPSHLATVSIHLRSHVSIC